MVKRDKPNSLYSGTKRTLVPEALGEFHTEGEPVAVPMDFEFLLENSKGPGKRQAPTGRGAEAVAVPMDFEFLLENSKGPGKRQAHTGRGAEAVPVPMNFEFLLENSKGPGKRQAPTGRGAEEVPVPMNLGFLTKPTEIAGKRRVPSSLIAVGFHALVLVGALLVPLWHTETLDARPLMKVTHLVAPPPAAPPPPPRLAPAPATRRAVPTRRTKPVIQTLTRKLVRPTAIPHEIAQNLEPVVVELGGSGVPGDIPDGILGGDVPGGQLGGVIGGVLGGNPAAVPPPAEIDEPRGPVRVGGEVRPPQLLKYVPPIYPPIAQRARVRGTVRIDAIIDANGRVVEMRVLAGHPLLVSAAMHAVRQWIYEPTYVNGQPFPVVFEITVVFRAG